MSGIFGNPGGFGAGPPGGPGGPGGAGGPGGSGGMGPRPQTGPRPAPSGRSRALAITGVVLLIGFFLLSAFAGIWTDRLWFESVGYGNVFSTMLSTKVLLFVIFSVLFGGLIFLNIVIAYRSRPSFRPSSLEQASLDRYRDTIEPIRTLAAIVVAGGLGIIAGLSAAGEWRFYLMWKNGKSFGEKDPQFGKDLGFFIFDLPWLHYVVNVAMTATVLALLAAIVVHYLFGGIRLQAATNKVSGAAQAQFSVLLGVFVLIKAVDYWLDRFDLTTEQGRRFTGINYTADSAQIPAKDILIFIAVICALLFFANVVRRTWMLPSVGLGLLVLSAILLGAVWPGIVYQFQVKPTEQDKEAPFLQRNIDATRAAYGIEGSVEQPYAASISVDKKQLQEDAASLPGIRLVDPALVNDTFEQLQQGRAYYSVGEQLDVDRYTINGRKRDLVLGVREVDLAGLKPEQRSWTNERTVYTHGYGLIAAFGNQRNEQDQEPNAARGIGDNDGEPFWAEGFNDTSLSDLEPDGIEPRIYFGEKSPSYSIVGKRAGGQDVELDRPDAESGEDSYTYEGPDGVSVGNIFNKALYALRFGHSDILLSSRVHENSKVLYHRNPRERVEKVAPWLTVDSDPYPALVDGRILWILDGFTVSDRYPNSERRSLTDMTADRLTPLNTFGTLPTDQINYMRNSVKATVDAYSGEVSLYEWDADPILESWKSVFPGVVKDRDEISADLLQHLRYPEDLFKVQRHLLAQYHVTEPLEFFQGTNRWEVPIDPADSTNTRFQPPYRLSVQMPQLPGEKQQDAAEAPQFSLTSVFVPANKSNLAGFISVNSEAASEQYGQIQILRLPDNTQIQGPSQVANTFSADEGIQGVLLPLKNSSKVQNGNLLTLPVGGGLLYVQPVYALRESGSGTYPVLAKVLAAFGKNVGFGDTLSEALVDVLATNGVLPDSEPPAEDEPGNKPDGTDNQPKPGRLSAELVALLEEMDATQKQADRALRRGDLAAYGEAQDQLAELIQQAVAEAQRN